MAEESKSTILHVDSTHDMSLYYATSICYFNTKLERRKTKQPSLFGGPVLLHATSHTFVYFLFWQRVKGAMKIETKRWDKHNAI